MLCKKPNLPAFSPGRWVRFHAETAAVIAFTISLVLIFSAIALPIASAEQPPGISSGALNEGSGPENADKVQLSEEEMNELIRTIENDTSRKRFIKQLKALAAIHKSGKNDTINPELPSARSMVKDLAQWFADKYDTISDLAGSSAGIMVLAEKSGLTVVVLVFTTLSWMFFNRRLYKHLETRLIAKLLSKVVLFVFAGILLLWIWGVDLTPFFLNPFGAEITTTGLTIIFVIGLGIATWEAITFYFKRRTARLDTVTESGRRARTLFPLLRNVVRVVIIVICILLILPELGINIGPLLAGAGIAGIAIGFGAQTLVKDLINGFMLLAEHAINVGDWVVLGGHDGQVEGLSIRNVRLRDIYGNVHTIPWSSVDTVTNQTKQYGYAVVEPAISYRENIDEVVEIVKAVAGEMREDTDLATDILGDLEMLGLTELGDSAVVIRTRFKTTPFKRWFLERDFRRRLKNRFDELGIEIPFPHRTLYFGEDKSGSAPPAAIRMINNTSAPAEKSSAEKEETPAKQNPKGDPDSFQAQEN